MKLAISNLAWEPQLRHAAYDLLSELGVRGLEIAPGLTFVDDADWFSPCDASLQAFRNDLQSAGLQLVSVQSILYGPKAALLFGTADERARFEQAVARAATLAARIGAPNIVMGAPANRVIPPGTDRTTAEAIAYEVFKRLGDVCHGLGVSLAIEANPEIYGTNFLNTTGEALAFVERIDHPAVTLNFDLGAIVANGEADRADHLFAKASARVSHVHVSEPLLAPISNGAPVLARLAPILAKSGYNRWISIEMRCQELDPLAAIRHAVETCKAALGAGQH